LDKGYISELALQNLEEPWEKEFTIKNLTNGKEIKLHCVRLHENTGGTGGFYEVVKRGYEKSYLCLWLIDGDIYPTEAALENLITKIKAIDINKRGFLCSQNIMD